MPLKSHHGIVIGLRGSQVYNSHLEKEHSDYARVDGSTVTREALATASLFDADTPACGRAQGAIISADQRYRYRLWRQWGDGDTVAFVMLNPSTADAEVDDPTIRKCVGFAKGWGFSRLEVVNLFAWRATNPKELRTIADPIGIENDQTMTDRCLSAKWVIAAWGSDKFAYQRARGVTRMLTGAGVTLRCLRTSKYGHPWQPLYVPYATMPRLFADAR